MEDAIGVPVMVVCNLLDESGRIVQEDFADRVVCESRAIALPDTTRLVSRDGRETPVEGSVSPIFDSRGEFLGTVMVLRNIAARLELERLRRQTEERARRAQKMQSVGRLAGGLSHRLNDMLTAILGNTSLVLTEFPPDAEHANGRRLLQDVELAAQNAAELVQRLRHVLGVFGRRFARDARAGFESDDPGVSRQYPPAAQFASSSDARVGTGNLAGLRGRAIAGASGARARDECPARRCDKADNYRSSSITLRWRRRIW